MNNYIAYIGDFDFRNENVQSFLVRNNGRILNSLGFRVAYIGINTKITEKSEIDTLPPVKLDNGDAYYELPYTLNLKGGLKYFSICKKVICYLDRLMKEQKPDYLISYQAPTYSLILKRLVKWCKKNEVKYIVNCADLPTFDLQPLGRRQIMEINWHNMHQINKRYADGIIAVSRFISDFYQKPECPSIIIPPLFDQSKYAFNEPKPTAVTSFIYAGIPFKTTGHEAAPEGMKDRLDVIIDIFLKLTEINIPYRFDIIGITKEDYLSGVPRHKDSLEKAPDIVFLGRKNHYDTLKLVEKSDFSINYRDENLMTKAGLSTKVVESVSVGTPVIINHIGDTFNYLEEGITGFALNGNIIDDMETIIMVCGFSKADRLQMKVKCRERGMFDTQKYRTAVDVFLKSL